MPTEKPKYRVLLDEGVPVGFGKYLKRARHNVEHIKLNAQQLISKGDNIVVAYAVKTKRILIATDADFSHRGSDLVEQVTRLKGSVIRISGPGWSESLKIIWKRQAKNLPRHPKGIFVIGNDSYKKLA